ncbi:MAG: ribosome small subunit-dependent GTPase A [Tissierellia bacterium]|nr:ribosome small subunit-dependent GTPase A [Tissierellia bacterium]
MKGKIIKQQKELYYVDTGTKVYKSKARGVFRKKNIKPIVGDNANIQILDEDTAYITDILERKNRLKRPEVSNLDQLFVFVTIKSPPLNLYNLDKYLSMCEYKNIDVVLILTKIDLYTEDEIEKFKNIYTSTGYKIIEVDNFNNFPKEEIFDALKGKSTAFSGASGVGKSTMINNLIKDIKLETGSISKKSLRGKNTTRHTELFKVMDNSFVFDTPGFDSFDFDFIEDERELKNYFIEFKEHNNCKYSNCNHIKEPGCNVKDAVEENLIAKTRYNNYVVLFNELEKRRKTKW